MLEIVYTSAAVTLFTEAQLEAVLAHAWARNARRGVTGMLLYDRGSFLQVIEGETSATRGLFEVINKDARHRRIIKISEAAITTRTFDQRSMGYVSLDRHRAQQPRGYLELFTAEFCVDSFLSPDGREHAREILLAFRNGRFRTHVET